METAVLGQTDHIFTLPEPLAYPPPLPISDAPFSPPHPLLPGPVSIVPFLQRHFIVVPDPQFLPVTRPTLYARSTSSISSQLQTGEFSSYMSCQWTITPSQCPFPGTAHLLHLAQHQIYHSSKHFQRQNLLITTEHNGFPISYSKHCFSSTTPWCLLDCPFCAKYCGIFSSFGCSRSTSCNGREALTQTIRTLHLCHHTGEIPQTALQCHLLQKARSSTIYLHYLRNNPFFCSHPQIHCVEYRCPMSSHSAIHQCETPSLSRMPLRRPLLRWPRSCGGQFFVLRVIKRISFPSKTYFQLY